MAAWGVIFLDRRRVSAALTLYPGPTPHRSLAQQEAPPPHRIRGPTAPPGGCYGHAFGSEASINSAPEVEPTLLPVFLTDL